MLGQVVCPKGSGGGGFVLLSMFCAAVIAPRPVDGVGLRQVNAAVCAASHELRIGLRSGRSLPP